MAVRPDEKRATQEHALQRLNGICASEYKIQRDETLSVCISYWSSNTGKNDVERTVQTT